MACVCARAFCGALPAGSKACPAGFRAVLAARCISWEECGWVGVGGAVSACQAQLACGEDSLCLRNRQNLQWAPAEPAAAPAAAFPDPAGP